MATMRQVSEFYAPAINRSHRIRTRVRSYLGGKMIADQVPNLGGAVSFDDSATLRRSLTLTVPLHDGTDDWDPGTAPTHPLAAYGQRLHVEYGVLRPYDSGVEWLDQGWYLISEWSLDETSGTVEVHAVDLAQLLADARLYTLAAPPAGATRASEFTAMLDGILPVRINPDLGDGGPVPVTTVYDRDRTKNLDDLVRPWGARWFVDDSGTVAVEPAYGPVDDQSPITVRLHSGAAGQVLARSRAGTRDRLYNAVVVTGKAPDQGSAPYAVAEVTDVRSPIRVSGPYGHKPRFYASDQLTTSQQCQQTADALLGPASSVSRSEPVTVLPDPAVELGDVVEVYTAGLPWRGRVTAIELPLTPDAMKVTVANKPRDDAEGES